MATEIRALLSLVVVVVVNCASQMIHALLLAFTARFIGRVAVFFSEQVSEF